MKITDLTLKTKTMQQNRPIPNINNQSPNKKSGATFKHAGYYVHESACNTHTNPRHLQSMLCDTIEQSINSLDRMQKVRCD